MLISRKRLGRSYLKSHSYSIGLSDLNTCSCNNTVQESPLHYITRPNFAEFHQTLYCEMEQQFIPNFKKLSLKRQYEIKFFYGYEPSNLEMININSKITK